MFEIILVQFLDINIKYNFIEVIPYILEIWEKKKKSKAGGDMQGEGERFQGTFRSKEKEFPAFGHLLLKK